MVNQANGNAIESNGGGMHAMKIAANGNIFSILSDKIYERPVEAIVREVFSNAIDANIEAGKTSGLRMHLPTTEEQYFSVSDEGIGMDEEKILEVFFTYGASTKSNDNNQIGGFGIGAKTPFAYTDQFTIESKKNGKKTTFIAMKDEDGCPVHSDPFYEDCGDETGTTISFNVKEPDIGQFYEAAVKVLMFSKEFPELNEEAIPRFEKRLEIRSDISTIEDFIKCRELNKTSNIIEGLNLEGVFVEMGGVLYSIDSSVIPSYMSKIFDNNRTFLMHLPIGSLSVQASREKLNFTKTTVENLTNAARSTVASIIKGIEAVVNDNSMTISQRHEVVDSIDMDNLNYAANF